MNLRYERVTDEAGARAVCAIEQAAVAVDHPGLKADPPEDIIGVLPDGTPTEHVEFEVVYEGDDPVAVSFLLLPTRDNTHTANANVTVAPHARRRGIGRQVAQRLVDRIRSEGRKLVVAFIGAPIDSTPPGDGLAASLGAIAALGTMRRALDVSTIDDARLAAIEQEVGAHADGYEVVQWVDSVPDELVDGAATLLPLVFGDSPRGKLEFDDEIWDAARFREYEPTIQKRDRTLLATGAVQRATGLLAAYTEITVPRSDRQLGWQWGTIVAGAHRGHRLGLLVKAENLRLLRRTFPETETVVTWNAAENAHMIAVNELLGFRVAERYHAWQLTL